MKAELSIDSARKHGLAPVGAREDARLLIMGSLLGEDAHALIDLPSSSPALTLRLADKLRRWAALKPYVIDGPARSRPKPKP